MTCRNCGTEIADKAIVCYRCGTPTTDPVRQPPPGPSKWETAPVRSSAAALPSLIALILLVVLGLYLGYAPASGVPRPVAYVVAALAAVLLIWRLLARLR
jgi:hypothetical protein